MKSSIQEVGFGLDPWLSQQPLQLYSLNNKILDNEEVNSSDVAALTIRDLNQASHSQCEDIVSLTISALKHTNKADPISVDRELLQFLARDEDLFKNITLNNHYLKVIGSKLSKNASDATVLLRVIAKHQPLPKTVRIALANVVKSNLSRETNKLAISCINDSLNQKGKLISSETVQALSEFIFASTSRSPNTVSTVTVDNSMSELEALALLMKQGRLTQKQSERIGKFKGHPSSEINKIATKLLAEYNVGYHDGNINANQIKFSKDLQRKIFLTKNAAKYLAVFSSMPDRLKLCTAHITSLTEASKIPSIDFNILKINKYLGKAIAKSIDPQLLLKQSILLFQKAEAVSEKTVTSLISKLPFGIEELDKNILGLIFNKIGKVEAIDQQSQDRIKSISESTANAETVRIYANKLYGAILTKFPLQNSSKVETCFTTNIVESGSKSLQTLKNELLALNQNNSAITGFAATIDRRLTEVINASNADSILAPQNNKISNYSATELCTWAKAVKQLSLSFQNSQHVSEVMAAICRAVELDRSYSPRDVQRMSVLLLLDSIQNNQGRLLQIKTGEGKSTITAMLAAAKVLIGKNQVDIVTSSKVLAERDSSEQNRFFQFLGVSCGHNCMKQQKGFKECYKSDVVYGDSLNFQADLLRSEFKLEETRGARRFEAVIVDEVDSMLIDEAAKIAKLALPICGMEHLETIFIFTSNYLKQMQLTPDILQNKELSVQIEAELTETIERIISPNSHLIAIPNFLKSFVAQQSKNWAHSALTALKMQENIDYVIALDAEGEKVIAPVDYGSTGVIQVNTSWSNGLHQFLQVKHCLRMSSESLTTSFISNMSFFRRYSANIAGMTGTLGSESARNLLENIYKLDTLIVPTFKPKRFGLFPGCIVQGQKDHIEKVALSAIKQANDGRAILVIAETIAEGLEITTQVRQNYSGNCKQYLRTDDKNYNSFDSKAASGDIIIATNLAGRGTDIITSKEVEDAGGLHVIITFLPNNLRVEEQALGRTSRQGNKGSGEIIINGCKNQSLALSLEELKENRDKGEAARLEFVRNTKIPALEFEDNLFQKFNNEIYQPLCKNDDNTQKLMQLEDLWGFWLVSQKEDPKKIESTKGRNEILSNFEQFKQQMLSKYNSGTAIIASPAYMSNYVLNKLGEDSSFKEPCGLLSDPNNFDPFYSYQMHYLRAYSQLRFNGAIRKDSSGATAWRQNSLKVVVESLQKALSQIEEVIMPQLQSAILQLGPEATNSPLHKQLDNKLRLLDTAIKNIKENIEFIQQENRPGENTIMVSHGKKQTYLELFSNEIHPSDIREFSNFGLTFLYHASSKSYSKDYLSGSLVAIVGVAQVVVGAVLAIGSAGFAAEFGISLAVGGIGDIIGGVSSALEGRGINLNNWAKGKGIEIAVSLAMAGISSSISKSSKAATIAKGGEVIDKTLTPAMFGVALGKRIATSYVVDFAIGKMEKAASRPIKAETKELEAAIRQSLKGQQVSRQMQEICLVDSLNRPGGHKREFERQVLSVIDRKTSEFANIAQNLLTHTMNNVVSSSAGAMMVTAGSTAVSVARGFEGIRDLKEYLLSGIESSASSVHSQLPGFEGLLQYSCRDMNGEEAAEITRALEQNGTLKGKYQVDLQKIGFVPGFGQITSTLQAAASAQSNVQKFEFQSLASPINVGQQGVMQAAVNSNSQLVLPGGNKYRLQTSELLHDLNQAGNKNYTLEVDHIAVNISRVVSDRMRGLIRSGIISPITGTVVSASLNYVLDRTGLEQAIIDHFESEAIGVAAGNEEEPGLFERLQEWKEEKALQEEIDAMPYQGEHTPETIIDAEKLANLKRIEKKLLEEYPTLPVEDRRALAFEILKLKQYWIIHPEKRPPTLLASGTITADVPLVTLPSVEQQAMRSVMNEYSSGTLQLKQAINDDPWQAFTPKTLKDIGSNLYKDLVNPDKIGSKYYLNLPAAALSLIGETTEYAGENVVYGISKLPGGKYALEAIGGIVGGAIDKAHSLIGKGAKLILTEEQLGTLSKEYKELPHGMQVLSKDIADGSIFTGAGKIISTSAKVAKKVGGISSKTNSIKLLEYGGHSSINSTWPNWKNVEKVTVNGKEYGKIGKLLFTQHCLENTYPTSLGRVAGHSSNHPPVGVAPPFIKMVLESSETKIYDKVVNGVKRRIYDNGELRVVMEGNIVITVIKSKKLK